MRLIRLWRCAYLLRRVGKARQAYDRALDDLERFAVRWEAYRPFRRGSTARPASADMLAEQ